MTVTSVAGVGLAIGSGRTQNKIRAAALVFIRLMPRIDADDSREVTWVQVIDQRGFAFWIRGKSRARGAMIRWLWIPTGVIV